MRNKLQDIEVNTLWDALLEMGNLFKQAADAGNKNKSLFYFRELREIIRELDSRLDTGY